MRALGREGDLGGRWSRQVEVRRVPGRVVETEANVTAYETAKTLAVRRATGPVRPEARYDLEPRPDGGTLVRFTLEARLGGLTWLLWPVVTLALWVVVRPALRPDFERLRAALAARPRH